MEEVLRVVYSVLNADTDVTDITTGLYPFVAPEKSTFPLIVYSVERVEPFGTKSGPSTLDNNYVRIDLYAQDKVDESGYATVSTLSRAVRAALDRLTPGTYSTIDVRGVDFVGADSGFDKESDVYVISMEFKITAHR